MANFPILEFTDGTELGTVSLLKPFFKVESRRVTIVQAKGGGTWQSSPLAEGRRLVNRQRGNAIETIELSASAATQDSWAHQLRELERLMEKAVEYSTAAWQNTSVYWVDKAGCVTNKRHAIIYDYSIPSLGQILRAPFASKKPGMVGFSISIERGNWLADPPGSETCVAISGTGAEGHETTEAFSPGLYTDDGSFDSLGALDLTGTSVFMGDVAATEFDGIVHFSNVTIPQGSIITGADVTFEAAAADVGAPVLQIKGEASDNAATLSTAANWTARTLTGNAVAWGPGAWVLGVFYPTPDISTIVQEIVNRPGWVSGNDILIVVEDNGSPVGIHREFESTSGGGVAAALNITYLSASAAGRAATCDAEVFVANKHNYRGLTHIWYDDGGAFSGNLLGTAFPQTLLPAVPAVGDILYFGIEAGPAGTITGGGPFFSLVFDLLAAQTGVTFANGWEFWNGGAWAALTVIDNTDSGQPLDTTGVNSVHWREESSWTKNVINAVNGYWVRLEITAIGAPTPPTQQSRDIYTILWPYVEIDSAQVEGDIAALLRAALDNQARYNSNADIARVIMSLRSNSRGLDFSPYLNCNDSQEIPGVSFTVPGTVSISTEPRSPTDSVARWSPGGAVAMFYRARWTFADTAVATAPSLQWYGSYHAFARVDQTAGTSGHFAIQLTVDIGDQEYNSSGSPATVQNVGFAEVVDLGRIDIPQGSGVLDASDVLDTLVIELHASTLGAGTLDFYDLILIPADEMLIDAQIQTNTLNGGTMIANEILSIDSVVYPKSPIRSLVRNSSGRVMSIWRTKGPLAFLQSSADQRLWFLLMSWDASSPVGWTGRFSMAARMQAFANRRYLALRGER